MHASGDGVATCGIKGSQHAPAVTEMGCNERRRCGEMRCCSSGMVPRVQWRALLEAVGTAGVPEWAP